MNKKNSSWKVGVEKCKVVETAKKRYVLVKKVAVWKIGVKKLEVSKTSEKEIISVQ